MTFGKLIVLKKSGAEGGICQLREKELLIGRDPEACDIQIRLPEVSKIQARLLAEDVIGRVWAENCSSTNPMGTLLNDTPITEARLLKDGDVVRARSPSHVLPTCACARVGLCSQSAAMCLCCACSLSLFSPSCPSAGGASASNTPPTTTR